MPVGQPMPGVGKLGHYKYNNPPAATTNPRQIAKNNEWAAYFGVPQTSQPIHSYDGKDVTTWTLPEAYRGESNFFGNTFEILALTNNSFLTSYILPIRKTTALRSDWSRWEFNPHLADLVPVRGVVRFVKSNRRQGGVSFLRWGIGGMWEHGFMDSPLGRTHFAMNLRQINQAINETLQFDALYAIATAEDETIRYLRTHELERNKYTKMMHVMQRELDYWAILQQEKNAWALMDSLINRDVEKYNQRKLTTYITDIRASVYLKLRPEEKINYYKSGRSISTVQDGVESFHIDELGQRVYTSRSFLVDEDGPINPLQQPYAIGEHFKCFNPEKENIENYTSKCRTQQFYDQNKDTMSSINLMEKLNHCNRFNPANGKLWSFNDSEAMHYGTKEFSTSEKGLDFLHYFNSKGDLAPVRYFGQIQHSYLGFDDYMRMAKSVLREISRNTGKPTSYFQNAINDLQEALQIMTNTEFSDEYNMFLRVLASVNRSSSLTVNPDTSIPPQLRIAEHKSNAYKSWNLPTDDNPTQFPWNNKMALPPTHATYGGMKTIRDAVMSGQFRLTGFNLTWGQRITDAIEIFDKMVPHLEDMFPGSLLLKSKWASNYIHNATAKDVLFENMVACKFGTRPIFIRRSDKYNSSSETLATDSKLSILNSILVDAPVARKNLMRRVIGMWSPSTAGKSDIGSRFDSTSKPTWVLDKTQYINNGKDISSTDKNVFVTNYDKSSISSSSSSSSTSSNESAIFERLKKWVLSPVGGTNIQERISSQIDLGLILGTLVFVHIDESDPDGTMDRFNAVLDQLEKATYDNNGIKSIRNRTQFIDTMTSFFTGRESDLLTKGLDVNNHIKTYYNTVIAKGKNQKLIDLATTRNADTNYATGLPEFSGLDRGGQDYFRAPIVMGHAALRSFVRYNKTNIDKLLYGYPSSTSNPATFATLQELQEGYIAIDRLNSSGANTTTINSMIGSSSIHPSLFASNNGFIGSDISHLPFVQKAKELQHTGEFDSLYDQQMEAARRREQQQRNSSSRRSIAPGVRSLPIGSHFGTSHTNKFLEDVNRERIDNVHMASIPVDQRRQMFDTSASKRRKLSDLTSRDDSLIDDVFSDTNNMTIQPSVNFTATNIPGRETCPIDAFIDEQLSTNMRKLYEDIMNKSRGLAAMIASIFLTTEVTLDFMKSTIHNNLMHPFNYICIRPHARYDTLLVSKLIPGIETGRVNLGHIQSRVGDDAATGTHTLAVNFYARAEVTNSKNIYNIHNAMVVDYNGGLGSGFYNRNNYNPSDDEYGDPNDSFFIFAIPINEPLSSNPISITGKRDWVDGSAYNIDAIRAGSALDYSTAAFYSGYWGFSNHRLWNTKFKPDMYKKYSNERSIPNSMSFASLALYYNPRTGNFDKSTSNTGHWRNQTVFPGAHRARIGKAAFINDPSTGIIHNKSIINIY